MVSYFSVGLGPPEARDSCASLLPSHSSCKLALASSPSPLGPSSWLVHGGEASPRSWALSPPGGPCLLLGCWSRAHSLSCCQQEALLVFINKHIRDHLVQGPKRAQASSKPTTEPFHGYARWDGGSLKSSPFPSLSFCSRPPKFPANGPQSCHRQLWRQCLPLRGKRVFQLKLPANFPSQSC